MEWKAVNHPQIAEIGFEEPEKLGVRFQPAKWQQKKNLPGNEYHYSGFDNDAFALFSAAPDIDAYFAEHIRPFPDKYPFVKVA